ncbi:TMV resistance protein N-like [Durio zibethinus]|uniref:TMV resistance protein N-like n=1 Tax=Durio zibethinus TaxID=66656 RepID=A0A6P5ZNL6_DURZI|nr:TMV resistance protein N-like [Durio zibethinus]
MHMPAAMMNFHRSFLARQTSPSKMAIRFMTNKAFDVFINHRGIDTKRTIATLLYDHLSRLNLQPFLDNKNMKPGDKLFDNIDNAIRNSKIGVTVFSPNYCQSYFCLHELALIMESKKKVIPIFCDIKPSQLRVENNRVPAKDFQRFKLALEQAKYTVGLTFDSLNGNWSDVVTSASEIVIESLIEMESEEQMFKRLD